MGPVFRRFGAFFVRRSLKGAVFYARVFSEYIHMLLDQGFNIAVFIEGTRSRNGKLLLPKLGMLAVLLNAVRNGACDTSNFVPVFIGYDRVPELGSYIHEMQGGRKEPENFLQMIRARKLLKKRFGKIYLTFCAPISLKDLARRHGTPVWRHWDRVVDHQTAGGAARWYHFSTIRSGPRHDHDGDAPCHL